MKKLFAILAIAGVMVACNNKKKDEKKPEGDSTATTTTTTTTTDPTTTTVAGVPTFADAEVQSYVNDYTAFVNSYIDACKTKDMSKVQDLSLKATDWTSRSMDVVKKLAANQEEATKFSDFMSKMSQQWAEAAKALMPSMPNQ
ncbi:MAG: hypothetical protein HZB42_02875 [Sphingobacteriales bacterium]|nr:hypothetical protein [Sphingobacteriales bacterium]